MTSVGGAEGFPPSLFSEDRVITLTVTFDPATGQVQVTGPIQDKILCCGLLEMAKSTVLKQEVSRIIPALVQKGNGR